MNKIKFSCPNCSQHISAGLEVCGTEIACPSCQTRFVVPEASQAQNAGNDVPSVQPTGKVPGSATGLAWYFIVGALPFILFALMGFSIPPEELTNHPQHIDRDRGFLNFLKVVMFGGLLVYSVVHLVGGIGLLRSKKWGYKTAKILSILGIFHLNPFAVPGLIICSKKNVREFYGEFTGETS